MRKRYYEMRRKRKMLFTVAGRLIFLIAVCYVTAHLPKKVTDTAVYLAQRAAGSENLRKIALQTGFSQSYDIAVPQFSPIGLFFPSAKKTDAAQNSGGSPNTDDSKNGGEKNTGKSDEKYASPNGNIIAVTMTGEGSASYKSGGGVYYRNKTQYDIDMDKIIAGGDKITVSGDKPQVLVIHTHGSESYEPDGDDTYVPSDPSRTEDRQHNMVRVGDEFCKVLESRGISYIHDTELYDYPSYTGSYNRSMEAIDRYLKDNPSIKIVLDLHRDALEGDGKTYKVEAKLPSGEPCSQVMLVVGTDYNGLEHPHWQKNLAFAVSLQKTAVSKYATLMRPIVISGSRYNQQATNGSLIVEVGTNGNTLKEALHAVRLFADAFCDTVQN